MTKYDNENNRKDALKRAEAMKFLFDSPNFADIMNAVDPTFIQKDFDDACNAANLKKGQKKWLQKYLENCNQAVYADPDVASTGW